MNVLLPLATKPPSNFLTQVTGLLGPLAPIKNAWDAIFVAGFNWILTYLYHAFMHVPLLVAIGAYGLAVVVLTIIVKLILWPLFHFQISNSKKAMDDQRRIGPELAAIRKKFKGDQAKVSEATMALYKEHGINPLANLSGCLPSLAQIPILIALYWVLRDNATSHAIRLAHFLFVPDLNVIPASIHLAGLPIPTLAYLILPVLAGATAFVQAKMMQQPPNPNASEQELQTQQVGKTMVMVMPFTIGVFALQTPAGLGLYWFISNCVAIVQQYLVFGWGGLKKPGDSAPGPSPSLPPPQPKPTPRAKKPTKRSRR